MALSSYQYTVFRACLIKSKGNGVLSITEIIRVEPFVCGAHISKYLL
jgi:hypothetical protein